MNGATLVGLIVSGLIVLLGALFSVIYLGIKKYIEKLAELSAEDYYQSRKSQAR